MLVIMCACAYVIYHKYVYLCIHAFVQTLSALWTKQRNAPGCIMRTKRAFGHSTENWYLYKESWLDIELMHAWYMQATQHQSHNGRSLRHQAVLTTCLVIGRRNHSVAIWGDSSAVGWQAKRMRLALGIPRVRVLEVRSCPVGVRGPHGSQFHVPTAAWTTFLCIHHGYELDFFVYNPIFWRTSEIFCLFRAHIYVYIWFVRTRISMVWAARKYVILRYAENMRKCM
jgi:hypothetical protein